MWPGRNEDAVSRKFFAFLRILGSSTLNDANEASDDHGGGTNKPDSNENDEN